MTDIYFSQIWRLEVEDLGAVFGENHLSGSKTTSSLCVHVVEGSAELSGVSYKDSNPVHDGCIAPS